MNKKFVSFILLFVCLALPFQVHASRSSYFTMLETRSGDLTPFPKWTGMHKRFKQQSTIPLEKCDRIPFHPCSIESWRRTIERSQGKPLSQQLKAINGWANSNPYIIDQINWGMEDFWETPHEFLSVSGDCEDYAIAKYYSLRALGVPESAMRIIIVQDLNLGGIVHAVLGVYDGATLYILDNQIKQVMPALKIYHYRPIYSLNKYYWWAYYTPK